MKMDHDQLKLWKACKISEKKADELTTYLSQIATEISSASEFAQRVNKFPVKERVFMIGILHNTNLEAIAFGKMIKHVTETIGKAADDFTGVEEEESAEGMIQMIMGSLKKAFGREE